MALLRGKQIEAAAAANGLAKDGSGNFAIDTTTDAVTFTTAVWTFPVDSLQVTGTPDSDNDATNKSYVDTSVANINAGLHWKKDVLAASTQDLTSETYGASGVTYANGTAGAGATLTQDVPGDGAFGSLDGVSISQDDRVLIKDQTAGAENGIYELTEPGDGASTAWVLTRVVDADVASELDGATTKTQQGTTQADKWYHQTASNLTIGTTSLTWSDLTPGTSEAFKTVVGDTGTAMADSSTDSITIQGGNGVITTAADDPETLTIDLVLNGDSLAKDGSGLKGAVLTSTDQFEASAVADSSANDTTGITLGATPAGDSHVMVMVNGLQHAVSYSAKTSDFYWSSDGGTTVAAQADLASGHELFTGTGLGYDLDTSDLISLNYPTTA